MIKQLRWYWHRLLAMSPREIVYRVRQSVPVARECYHYVRRRGAVPSASFLGGQASNALNNLIGDTPRRFLPLLRTAMLPRAVALANPRIQNTIREADRMIAGEWPVFGALIRLGQDPDWHFDPVLSKRWPRRFYARVDRRSGGAKYIWEPSRHQSVAALARAFVWTGEARYAERARSLVVSWIRANPPYEGVHWCSPFECAVRLLSWSIIFHTTRATGVWGERDLLEFLASLAAQAAFVEAHPSRFSSANNHAIGEGAALACIGLAFPELPSADRWLRLGLGRLAHEFERQILPDGAGAEQAPYYLACLLDYGTFVTALAREQGVDMPTIVIDRVAAGARFLERLSAGTHRTPAIGDKDDSRAVPLDANGVDAYDAARIAACVICGDARLKRPGDTILERLYWLVGIDAAEQFASLAAEAPVASSEIFPQGGYGILVREPDNDRAIMDIGPLGYLSLAAHGHGDALSVVLDGDSGPLLIDPGTYVYHEQPAWRRFFRGTRAHNTVTVAHQDQSESLGSTLWGRRARVRRELLSVGGSAQLLMARHDGYKRLTPPVTHRRALLAVNGGYWLVMDWLYGERVPQAELNWHLAASAVPYCCGVGSWRIETARGRDFQIKIRGSVPLESRTVSGDLAQPQGWISESYGERHPAPVLVATTGPNLGAVLVTVMSADDWDVGIVLHRGGHTVIELARAGKRDIVIVRPEARDGSVAWNDVYLDGVAALVQFDRDGDLTAYAVWQARALALGPAQIWTTPGLGPADWQEGL